MQAYTQPLLLSLNFHVAEQLRAKAVEIARRRHTNLNPAAIIAIESENYSVRVV